MTVRTRLAVFGALLPIAVLVISILVAGWRLRIAQLRDVDRRMMAQAAVESVGLFDGEGGRPHVHLTDSPIASEVAEFAPLTALYDGRGQLVIDVADRSLLPAQLLPAAPVTQLVFGESELAGVSRRTLELGVLDSHGDRYTLWLGTSLAPLDATMSLFYVVAFSVIGVLGLGLFVVQWLVARRIGRRIDSMIAFLPHLHQGAGALAPDPTDDELAMLRDVLRDVAERLAEARLEQDRLLASAAHELRTPLTVLRTEIDLALRKDRPVEELRDAMRRVRSDVDRIASLATALLDLQAIRHVDFHRVPGDLTTVVREACEGLRMMGEARGIEVRIIAPTSAPASFDERTLRQAIDNLVANALRHAPPNTVIDVELADREGRWELGVSDLGPGVPREAAERIFEPFQRLSATGPGAGLGLAIVREVAQRHGGRCWLDPHYQAGARFVFALGAG